MRTRSMLILYSGVLGILALILAWWVVFFSNQGRVLLRRTREAGVDLDPAEAEAVRDAAAQSMRMFLFEGSFLILLLVGGIFLLVRSMRREVQMYRQQRDLLSAVTHELKSPIASARLYLQSLALGRVESEDKRARYLRHAEEDLDRLAQMVERLLESARLSTGETRLALEPLDLAAFTRRAVQGMIESRSVELVVEAREEVPVVADPSALETILRNLIANAVKYGGDPPRINIHVERANGQAVLAVRDFGPGLSETRPDRVFEPFVRGENELVANKPGVGLGLYLVSELARALGGNVRALNVEAAGGGGLRVELSLPLARPEEAQA